MTPAIRLEIQAQPESVSNRELAGAYHLNRHTVAKWRRCEGMEDASHRPQRLHTTLTPVQEAMVVELRKTLLLPLDDLLAVTHEFIHPCGFPLGSGPLSAPPRDFYSQGADAPKRKAPRRR